MKVLWVLGISSILLGSLVGCGPKDIQSHAKDRDIVVDGDYSDWDGLLQFDEDANLSYGFTNDDKSLYIVIVAGDRFVRRQIMLAGMYLWFDPAGQKTKSFGMRYPIGLQEEAFDTVMPLMGEQDPEKVRETFQETTSELMIIGEGEEVWRRSTARGIDGVEAAAAANQNVLVLEFRVPVGKTGKYGYGIGSAPGDMIGVGVQTPEIDIDSNKDQKREAVSSHGSADDSPDRMGSGGRSGMGRGGMGRTGMKPGVPRRPGMPEPIKIWTRVLLATPERA